MLSSESLRRFLLESSSLYLWLIAFTAIGTVLILNFLVGCIQQKRSATRQVAGFPTPSGHWLRGHLDYIATQDGTSLQYYAKCAEEFKTAYSLWFGPLTSRLILCHPDTVKVVQCSNAPKAANQATRFLRPFLRDGLVISNGDKWLRMRRLLTPAFHFKILTGYVKVFHESTGVLLDKWSLLETGEVELFHDVSLMTLDSILKTAFSFHSNCQLQESQDPYISAVLESAEQIIARQLNPLLHNDTIYKLTYPGKAFHNNCALVHAKAEEVLKERRQDIQDKEEQEEPRGKKYLDFLDILLQAREESGRGLTDEEIIDEVVTFMFAGHDTTSSAISWTLYCLASFPEHQAKCQQELDDVFGDKDELDWHDLGNLKFLHMCIKESIRMYSPVPIIGRTLNKPYEIDGRLVPEGTWVMINIYALHHNPHVWQDPEKFDPFRFTTEMSKERSPYAFIPFAAGPRNCIGQNFAIAEIKLTVAMILRKYDLSVQPQNMVSVQDLKPLIVLRAKHGLNIHISSRNKSL